MEENRNMPSLSLMLTVHLLVVPVSALPGGDPSAIHVCLNTMSRCFLFLLCGFSGHEFFLVMETINLPPG